MDGFDPATAGTSQTGYRFGGFRLEIDGTLWRGDTRVPLQPRELAVLRLLLARAGRVITLSDLKRSLWHDEQVATDTVSKCIASLRKHLEPEDCIQTVYKRGYRFSEEARPFGGEPTAALPRLAIPPFATGQGVPEFLGSAIAEEAAARLSAAQPAAVSVLAQDSVFTVARRDLAPQQLGEMLKADYVLTGELHLVSSRYRLRAQMVRVGDGAEIWVEERLIDCERWVRLETELVRLVALRIYGHLIGGNQLGGPGLSIDASVDHGEEQELRPGQREAHEIFERARYEWQTLERHRMQDALQHLQRAVGLDPALSAARVNLAYLCVTQAFYGFMLPSAAADLVRREVRAIQDFPRGAETMLPALGWISFHFNRDLPAALRSFKLSADLPYDPWITRARTLFALSRHRFDEAVDLLRAAIRVDPWSAWLQARLAWTHHLSGDSAASLELVRVALERFPEHEGTQLYGAIILTFNGESERAIEVAQNLVQRLPYFDPATAAHAYTLAMAGRREEARTILERLQWLGRERYTMNTFAPAAYVALGEFDQALEALRVAEQLRCPWFFQMLADPRLKPLHDRPEFRSMLGILSDMETEAERES